MQGNDLQQVPTLLSVVLCGDYPTHILLSKPDQQLRRDPVTDRNDRRGQVTRQGMTRSLLIKLRVLLMTLADVALNAEGGGLSLTNCVASHLLQFRSQRRTGNELLGEEHVFERRAVTGLASCSDQAMMWVSANCSALSDRTTLWMTFLTFLVVPVRGGQHRE
jgi:hypothetical protein